MEEASPGVGPPRNHVVIVDGTLSSLDVGCETHAGRLYRLLCEGDEFNIIGVKQTEHRGTYLEISAVTGGL